MIRAAAVLALVITAGWPAVAQAEVIDGNRIVIIDGGDTVALPCAVPAPGCAEKIRFIDIDAPESFRPHCDIRGQWGCRRKHASPSCFVGQNAQLVTGLIEPSPLDRICFTAFSRPSENRHRPSSTRRVD